MFNRFMVSGIILLACLAVAMTGCGGSKNTVPDKEPVSEATDTGDDSGFGVVDEGGENASENAGDETNPLSAENARPDYKPAPLSDLKNVSCTMTFENMEAKSQEAILTILNEKAGEGSFKVLNSSAKSITYELNLTDLAQLYNIYKAIDALKTNKMPMEIVTVKSNVGITFRTTNISGSITVVIAGKVAPGATLKLGFNPEDMTDYTDKDKIYNKATGDFKAQVPLVKGKEYVYGVSELGAVTKYIRIDIWTGACTDITEQEFMRAGR
ncbi:MAG: hypothetical protein HZA48_12080 [Planctomycetes bacterium]|nr:hypothetical protein [Planctomycetota bacterium]